MKTIVDRATWRNGRHGKGDSRLINFEGYSCCLGFASLQSPGVKDEDIQDYMSMPSHLIGAMFPNTWDDDLKGFVPASPVDWMLSFAADAIVINDCTSMSDEERETELIKLWRKHGHEIEFIGEFKDENR